MKTVYVFLIFCAGHLAGQSLPSSAWTVSQATDLRTGMTIDYNGSFLVYGDRVEWMQKNIATDYRFEIKGQTGSWNESSHIGSISLNVLFRGRPGTIEFTGDGTEMLIRVKVMSGENDLFPYLFNISGFKKI